MTRSEWLKVVEHMRADWPHAEIPDNSIAKWYDDLKDREPTQVLAAVESFYRDSKAFPPNGGQILARLAELERDDPDHGEAWEMVRRALWKHVPRWRSFYADLHEQSPSVCEAARRYGFEAQSGYLVAEEGIVRAQFREIFKAVCSERQRDGAYRGLPAAGLRGISGNGPRKLDPRKAIGA